MNEDQQKRLLSLLKKGITPAIGCTEPIAVAYAAATAKEQTSNEFQAMQIRVDSNIYKNGLMVTIPGTKEKGLIPAAVFGYLFGKAKRGFRVIEGLTNKNIEDGKKLIQQNKVTLILDREHKGLYIEVILTTTMEKVRVVITKNHLNISSIEKIERNKDFEPLYLDTNNSYSPNHFIQEYTLDDFLHFIQEIPIENLLFLEEGVEMNLRIAQEGMTINSGVGATINNLVKKGIFSDNMVSRAQVLCAAAAEARMTGSSLPVMSTVGSGNHGITVFLTNLAVAEKQKSSKEDLLKSLMLSHLLTYFIKSYTGTLSAMCGCGVAAGIGASAGIAYLLGGKKEQILGALYNMVGSISGVVCDGAKGGCAYKLALASGWAIQSALLSLHGAIIHKYDGIVDPDFHQLFKNLGHLCDPGMISTDQAILDVMLDKLIHNR